MGNAAVVQMLRQSGHPWAQHQHGAGCGHQQTEQAPVQRSAVHDVLRTGGQPLDDTTRTEMEARLGQNFSDVRVHEDSAAKESAAQIGARAYTSGNHIVIGEGGADKHTLAHELTHVVQQRQGPVAGTDNGAGLKISDPSDRFEREAEANATRVMTGSAPLQCAPHQTAADAKENTESGTVQRAGDGSDSDTLHKWQNPEGHEEWPKFAKLMQDAGVQNFVYRRAWQLVMSGLHAQGDLNDAAETAPRGEQRKVINSNAFYGKLKELLANHMGLDAPMALWSGGIEVGQYARAKGYCPLEYTPAGAVMNALALTNTWQLKSPLWNALSEAYAMKANGPVHVFLRVYNPDTVLFQDEIPTLRNLMKLNPAIEIIWHPLYTETSDNPKDKSGWKLKEISQDLKLVDDAPYKSRDKAVRALADYLLRFHDQRGKGDPKYDQEIERPLEQMNARIEENHFYKGKKQ
ncbi:DUF4157 domain-containing protein [Streptomyces sp. NPDC049687]|uniref:eCIS core domain-containing protein n=1 Tax=Streptomyces sp. NPDC049687 TaxID=3365596 RepID=UPI0037A437E3